MHDWATAFAVVGIAFAVAWAVRGIAACDRDNEREQQETTRRILEREDGL